MAAGRALASLWMAFGIVVAALAAIELIPDTHLLWKRVLRLVDPAGGKPDERALADAYGGADWTKGYWREYMRNADVRWDPAVLWRTKPAQGKFVSVDADGHRRTALPPQPAGQPVRIFMMGGSTMFGMGARDEHTIASEVAARLNGKIPVEIINFGQPGWVMSQEVAELSEQLKRGNIPDVVLFYDGVNDVFSTMAQGRAGLPQNNDNREREFNLTNPSRSGALYREALLSMLGRTSAIASKLAPPRPAASGNDSGATARIGVATADYMAGNARQVRALAAAYGFRVVFALQPVIFDKATLTPFEDKARNAYGAVAPYYQAGYDAIRSHRDFANHADFHDVSDVFKTLPDPVYVDFCHLGENGNALVADRLADILRPMIGRAG